MQWHRVINVAVVLALVVMLAGIAPMAVATPGTPTFAGVTTDVSSGNREIATFSHNTAAGNNRLLIVIVGIRGDESVSSINYSGSPLTLAIANGSGTSDGQRVEIWYLADPPTGSNDVVVTYPGNLNPDGIAALSYTGVDTNNPIGAVASANSTTGTDVTADITTTSADSLIVGGLSMLGGDTGPSFTPGTGTTERYDLPSGTHAANDDSYAGGEEPATTAGTYTFNFTTSVSDWKTFKRYCRPK